MVRPRMTLAAFSAALAGSLACSHQQEVQKPPKVIAAAPRSAPSRPKHTAPPAVVMDGPKAKEGDRAIYFDFDSALLRDEARPVLQQLVQGLQQQPSSLRIEGNCDEVGTVEYNIALGDQRARAAKEYLIHLGVSPTQIATVTYGSQRPKYPGHDEDSRAKNRRDDIVVR